MSGSGPAVLIVGHRGRMGAMLLERAQQCGLDNVRGVDQPLEDDALASACAGVALAVLCVPVLVFEQVLEKICPHLPATCVLADITSVKERPVQLMKQLWHGPVVGTHPLFGPTPDWEGDLPVTITLPDGPADTTPPEAVALVEDFCRQLGFRPFRATPQEHDEAMARIQNMNFITNVAYFAMLAGRDDLLPYLTPSFRRRQEAARKMLTEDAAMFSALFEANGHSQEATRQFSRMLNLAAAGDVDLLCKRAQWWWEEKGNG